MNIGKRNSIPPIIAIGLVLIITAIYFVGGFWQSAMSLTNTDTSLYTTAAYKLVVTPDGYIKVFTRVNQSQMGAYPANIGEHYPVGNSIVIGAKEANMMIDEKLISGVGDSITDLFGANITVGGILKQTNSLADDMHFVDTAAFTNIRNSSLRFVVLAPKGEMAKAFIITQTINDLNITYQEGTPNTYVARQINGKTYLPVLIGSKEAVIMRQENLFKQPGDTIIGFFGNDIYVAGIIAPTGTIIDMAHIIAFEPEVA